MNKSPGPKEEDYGRVSSCWKAFPHALFSAFAEVARSTIISQSGSWQQVWRAEGPMPSMLPGRDVSVSRQERELKQTNWARVYLSVVLVTVAVILSLWWFSRAFS